MEDDEGFLAMASAGEGGKRGGPLKLGGVGGWVRGGEEDAANAWSSSCNGASTSCAPPAEAPAPVNDAESVGDDDDEEDELRAAAPSDATAARAESDGDVDVNIGARGSKPSSLPAATAAAASCVDVVEVGGSCLSSAAAAAE